MENLIITISTLILGGFIGYFTSLILEKRKNLILFNIKIFELYDKISQEIICILTEMTTLSLKPNAHDAEKIHFWKSKISELYFKYYNYLPQIVLNELNCLHSCLTTNGRFIYIIDTKNNLKQIDNTDKKSISSFFDDATLVSNDGRISKLIDYYGIESFPESIKINFQARRVIRRIDDFWGHKHLYTWMNKLKKQSILQNQKD